MKFKITAEHRYWWPVHVRIPDPDQKKAGQFMTQTFRGLFVSLPQAEAKKIAEEIAGLPPEEAEARQHAQLERVLVGWDEDVVGEDDRPVPFSIEALREALQTSWVRLGLYEAWGKSLYGDEARKGN